VCVRSFVQPFVLKNSQSALVSQGCPRCLETGSELLTRRCQQDVVLFPGGHPCNYWPRLRLFNFGNRSATSVAWPLVKQNLKLFLPCVLLNTTVCITSKRVSSRMYLLTNCMGQSSSWDANSSSPIQKMPRISWNSTVHSCLYHIIRKKSVQFRGCEFRFLTSYVCTVTRCWAVAQTPSWRTTPCRLPRTTYSLLPYLQTVPSVSNLKMRHTVVTGIHFMKNVCIH
jgi:hypothetical protein